MAPSRQETSRIEVGRTNQKTRTRTALLQAARELVQENRPPSVPEAAQRALVSVATAYRYFSSADELWWEASATGFAEISEQAQQQVEGAGTNPQARLETLIRSVDFTMLDDQMPYRQVAKLALDQWFRQAALPAAERVPVRQGRRNEQIAKALAPLNDTLPRQHVERITRALTLVIGTEAMISLLDAAGLDVPQAKATLIDAGRWLLAGALTELEET